MYRELATGTHRSSVVAREMSRKEVMLAVVAVVAVATLVQGQQQHQLMGCQQRCAQFYLESQQVKHSFALFFKPFFMGRGGGGRSTYSNCLELESARFSAVFCIVMVEVSVEKV